MGPVDGGASAAVLSVATLAGLAVARRTRAGAGTGRALLLGVLAFDLVGGLVAFQLRATRDQYARHAPRSRLGFVAGHLHPFLLPLAGQGGWGRAAARYVAAVGATVVLDGTLQTSPRRRAVGSALALALSAGDLLTDRSAQRWFGPVYLCKLVGGHGSIPATPPQSDHHEGTPR